MSKVQWSLWEVGEDTDSERAQKREEDQKFNMVSVMVWMLFAPAQKGSCDGDLILHVFTGQWYKLKMRPSGMSLGQWEHALRRKYGTSVSLTPCL
jgi:hypothetical protein